MNSGSISYIWAELTGFLYCPGVFVLRFGPASRRIYKSMSKWMNHSTWIKVLRIHLELRDFTTVYLMIIALFSYVQCLHLQNTYGRYRSHSPDGILWSLQRKKRYDKPMWTTFQCNLRHSVAQSESWIWVSPIQTFESLLLLSTRSTTDIQVAINSPSSILVWKGGLSSAIENTKYKRTYIGL